MLNVKEKQISRRDPVLLNRGTGPVGTVVSGNQSENHTSGTATLLH